MKWNHCQEKRSGILVNLLITLAAVVMLAAVTVPAQAQTFPVAFSAPTTFVTTGHCCPSTVAVATGDFNGDGKLDVVNIDSGSDLNVMLGNGDGTFQAPIPLTIVAANTFYEAIAVGDFNGDHLLDVALWAINATTGNSEVHIFLGNGTGSLTFSGTFSAPNSGTFNPGPNSLVATDVSGDGKLDLVALTPFSGVFVFLGKGDGSFQTPVAYADSCSGGVGSCNGLAVGDLNGDGKADLAIAGINGMVVLLNNGSGTFGAATYYPSGIAGAFAGGGIAIGDLNGDKKPDIVISNENSGVIVYLNQGTGTFTVKGVVGTFPVASTNNVVLADINNNKKLDIIVTDAQGDVFTFYGKGNGTFTAGPAYPLQACNDCSNFLAAVGDFNGDSALDLLATNGISFSTVSLGRGDGSFQTTQLYDFTSTNQADNLVTADFNGDGVPDIAQSSNVAGGGGKIAISLGSSHGVLGATSYAVASACGANFVISVATGDVNGDGKADLVATLNGNGGGGCQSNTVAVLTGKGTGKFNKAVYYPTGATVQEESVYLVDLNGDGKLDIVTENSDGSISVLLNKGNGTYNAGTLITSLKSIFAFGTHLTFADFNGDGKMDIAATAAANPPSVVVVLPGNGNGTFGTPVQTATPYFPTSLASADFNKDGKMDLFITTAANGCTNNDLGYAFLKGNGNGTFAPGPINCLSFSGPQTPVVADLNGDGKLDVVIPYLTGNGQPAGPAVLQGNGDGTFTSAQSFYTGRGATSAAIADFNGDGMPDVALVDTSGAPSFVSVMFNSTQPVSISPLNVTYGSVTVGTKKPETVILTNDQSTSLAISSVTVGGADAGDFSAKSTCGSSRKAGWNCTITVTFTPAVAGARTATLNIKDAIGTQTVQLSGTGK